MQGASIVGSRAVGCKRAAVPGVNRRGAGRAVRRPEAGATVHTMVTAEERTLAVPPGCGVGSLAWSGDELVDLVRGGVRYRLDGAVVEARLRYPFRFDAAILAPSGRLAVLYERLGTKAILVRVPEQSVVRELSRSYYFANTYEYPITFVTLPDGREAIAHCPGSYNRLELEDAATGECLTASAARTPNDVFHSRFVTSPDGTRLLSAGWCWHPYGAVCVLPIGDALRDPRLLDAEPLWLGRHVDVDSAVWLDDESLAIASCADPDTDVDGHRLFAWHLRGARAIGDGVRLAAPMGTMHRLGSHGLLGLHGHPRLRDATTGALLHEWPHLRSGTQQGAILRGGELPPPCAVHPREPWFAVAGDCGITVVQLA